MNDVDSFITAAQALAVGLKDDDNARRILLNYSAYLLSDKEDREYSDLATFLEWYGRTYLLEHILSAFEIVPPHNRTSVAEFGPGTGWLIGDLSAIYPGEFYAIDKRHELFEHQSNVKFMAKDLEQSPGMLYLPHGSTIIANQFLHCVDNVEELLATFRTQWWVVVEPISRAWRDQMRLFGATPLSGEELDRLFRAAGFTMMYDRFPSLWITVWRPGSE